MIQKELLAKIDTMYNNENCTAWICEANYKSIKSVIELHKPEGKFRLVDGELKEYFDNETRCKECSKSPYTVAYPCSTIKAIEKELK